MLWKPMWIEMSLFLSVSKSFLWTIKTKFNTRKNNTHIERNDTFLASNKFFLSLPMIYWCGVCVEFFRCCNSIPNYRATVKHFCSSCRKNDDLLMIIFGDSLTFFKNFLLFLLYALKFHLKCQFLQFRKFPRIFHGKIICHSNLS